MFFLVLLTFAMSKKTVKYEKLKAIAACMYPIPDEIVSSCNRILTDDLREINNQFVMLLKQRVSA